MRFRYTVTISKRSGARAVLLASKTFVGPYMGPIESDASAWEREYHARIEDEIEATREPVRVERVWDFDDDEFMLSPANIAERENVRRIYDSSKSGLAFAMEHDAEIRSFDRRFR